MEKFPDIFNIEDKAQRTKLNFEFKLIYNGSLSIKIFFSILIFIEEKTWIYIRNPNPRLVLLP